MLKVYLPLVTFCIKTMQNNPSDFWIFEVDIIVIS